MRFFSQRSVWFVLSVVFLMFRIEAAPSRLCPQAQKDLEELRSIPVDYTVFGVICEQVALLRLKAVYPDSDYLRLSGIEYFFNGKTVGELDVIVIEKKSNEAVLIGEVKCWKDKSSAFTKAKSQMARFQYHIEKGRVDEMALKSVEYQPYSPEQFDEKPKVLYISQGLDKNIESINADELLSPLPENSHYAFGETSLNSARGFNLTLGLTLDEVKALRNEIIRCQAQGACSQPE